MIDIISILRETKNYKYWIVPLIVVAAVLDFVGITLIYPLIQILVGPTKGDNSVIQLIIGAVQWLGLPYSGPFLGLYVAVILLLKAVFFVVYRTLTIAVSLDFQVRLSERIFTSLFESKYSSLSNELSRIYNAINTQVPLAAGTIGIFFQIVQNILILSGVVLLANIISWKLFLLFIVMSSVVAWAFKFTFSYVFKVNKQLSFFMQDLANNIVQSVSNVRYLKSTGLYEKFFQVLQPILLAVRTRQLKFVTLRAISSAFREPLTICVVLVLLFTGLYMGESREKVLIQTVIFYRIFSYLLTFFNQIQAYKSQAPNLEYCDNLLAELQDNHEDVGKSKYRGLEKGIQIRGMGFRFEASSLLQNVNMDINRREIVVLLGESGSGKTTILNLLTGLLKPTTGSIFVDGVSIQNIDLSTFRARLGLVTQESVVFNMSIRENLTMRTPGAGDEHLIEVIKDLALETIFPDKSIDLDYVIHENASNLSGGQRQRIAFAREIIAQPDILFLDEVTSALDDGTKERIINYIKKLKSKMTIVIATHQKDYIEIADRVYRLEAGEVLDASEKLTPSTPGFTSDRLLSSEVEQACLKKMKVF